MHCRRVWRRLRRVRPPRSSRTTERQIAIGPGWRHEYRRLHCTQRRLQSRAAFRLRARQEVLAAVYEDVEGDERRRRLTRQHVDARDGWMNPLQEGVEIEALTTGDHDFAIDDDAGFEIGAQAGLDLRKVAPQRPQIATLNDQRIAVPEDERAESVPLRLVQPSPAGGHLAG